MVGGEGLGPARNRSGPRAQDGGAALGMDLGRRRADGRPRLDDDRAPRRAASWRRRRAGGLGPASSTGVTGPYVREEPRRG